MRLYRKSVFSPPGLAEASARAEFDAAQGRLNQYGGGAGVPLRAPVSGVIADVRVAPGAFAQEGTTLFHIVDRRVLWLELRAFPSRNDPAARAERGEFSD